MGEKLSIDSIGPVALSLTLAIIIVAIGSLVLANLAPETYDTDALYTNYTFTANDTNLPAFGRGNSTDITIAAVYNESSQTYAGVADTNYHYYSNNNTLHIIPTVWSGTNALKSVNYYYVGFTNATYVAEKGLAAITSFADWFSIIIVVIVAVIIISLVMLLRGRGGES